MVREAMYQSVCEVSQDWPTRVFRDVPMMIAGGCLDTRSKMRWRGGGAKGSKQAASLGVSTTPCNQAYTHPVSVFWHRTPVSLGLK